MDPVRTSLSINRELTLWGNPVRHPSPKNSNKYVSIYSIKMEFTQ